MKYLFVPSNATGIGHHIRCLNIAKELVKIDKKAEILFYSRSTIAHIVEKEGFSVVKTPAPYTKITTHDTGKLEWVIREKPITKFLDKKTIFRLNLTGLINTLLNFDPTIAIVDIGAELTFLTKLLGYPVAYMCETFIWKKTPLRWRFALENADLLLVPYPKNMYTLPKQYRHKAVYTGPVSKSELVKVPTKKQAKKLIGIKEKLIVVNAGGGLDGYPIFKAAIKAYPLIRKKVKARMLILEGLKFPEKYKPEIKKLAKENKVIVKGFVPEILPYFKAADLAIASTGYNIVMELCSLAIPTIFLPLKRIYDEQLYKAKKIKELSLGDYSDLNPRNVAKKAIELLTNKERYNKIILNCKNLIDNKGGYRAANAVYNLAKKEK